MEGYRQLGEGWNGSGSACLWVMCTKAQFHMASGGFYTNFSQVSALSIKRELETCFTFREVVFTSPTVCLHETDCLFSRHRLSVFTTLTVCLHGTDCLSSRHRLLVFTTPTVCLHDTDCLSSRHRLSDSLPVSLPAVCLFVSAVFCLPFLLIAFLAACLLYKHLYHMLNFIFYLYLLSSSVFIYFSSLPVSLSSKLGILKIMISEEE
jgi:hypothetical protein